MKNKDGFQRCPFCGELPRTDDWRLTKIKDEENGEVFYYNHFCNGKTNVVISITGKTKAELKKIWNGRAKK